MRLLVTGAGGMLGHDVLRAAGGDARGLSRAELDVRDADAVREAVRAAKLDPPFDVHASSEYRQHLAEVLAVRAARQASEKS